ncbi:MAG: 23S rRNA (uracil(1939)-C(5))-methyltransferase RlmD [Oscillospiraceae bacterium]|nr:23S rRNA (uracil(1939)-C(5))-methyltransferase RlmD [Oscillospiraceae bacterium]
MKKNVVYQTEITGMTADGNGVCRIENIAVFVPMTAVGDILEVRIVKVLKSYAFGIIEKLITPADGRISPVCPVFRQCGGCAFQHIDHSTELSYKENFVRDAFTRIGKLQPVFEPILGSDSRYYYRNKAQYPIAEQDGHLVCGFYAKHSHRVIPYTACHLQPEIFTEILNHLLPALEHCHISAYDETSHTGELRHIYLRKGFYSGEIMLCLISRVSVRKKIKSLLPEIQKKFPAVISITESVNPQKTNVILGNSVAVLAGQNFITDTMCGKKIRISPQSFYQVNTQQAEKLYQIAKEYAAFQGSETLLDLYCGAGTIGLSMADSVKSLIGVEVIPEAVENAIQNAKLNQITNAEFFCGDAGTIADSLLKKNLSPDVIVLDPPRKGCDDLTIQSVIKMQPSRIVMISCNPSTAARDAAKFAASGYLTKKVRAVNLFMCTSHCETVLLLTRE